MIFLKVNNRKNFLIDKVLTLHPESAKYKQYWKLHKKRCIEGFWSQDDKNLSIDVNEELPEEISYKEEGWRFMTGNCYFYVNFTVILHRPNDAPKSSPKKKERPHLRDIEWEYFYNLLEARGFSGFSDDEEFSSNIELLEQRDKYHKTCYNSKGQLKQYIHPKDYLRKLHKKPLGFPLYENPAKDLFILGSRGLGKSYLIGVGTVLYEIIFDGAKVYNEDSIKNPFKVELFVGAATSKDSSGLLQKTEESMNNLPGDWAIGTPDYKPSPFFKQMSGSLGPNNMKNPWRHEYDKNSGGVWKKAGTGSNIKHGTYTIDNAEAAAGGRYAIAVVEEWGLLQNSLAVHGSNTATLMDFPWKFGTSIWIGTGGNVEKIQEGEVMFRDPEGFEALAFDDIWEGSGKIGWFIPAYYASNEFKDENGNTNVDAALAYINKRREEKKKSKDNSALALEMMNYPIKPSEMFLNVKHNLFPVAELKERKAELKTKPHLYQNAHYFGELTWIEGKLKWEPTSANNLVRDFPILDNKNKPGVIEIIVMPKEDNLGNVYPNRYIAGTDTYDDDESNTQSLGSIFIYDSWTDRIVAEYTGRRMTSEFYEVTRKLCFFYRAVNNYENNKKGLYIHYDKKNSIHFLADTPESLKDIADITISKIGNKAKGTNASTQVNAYGLRLLNEWLRQPTYQSDGTIDSNYTNVDTLQNLGLIDELINFNPERGNYDRISAMIMLMILKEDRFKITEKRKKKEVKDLSEDDFFKRNYNAMKNQKSNLVQLSRSLETFSYTQPKNIFGD